MHSRKQCLLLHQEDVKVNPLNFWPNTYSCSYSHLGLSRLSGQRCLLGYSRQICSHWPLMPSSLFPPGVCFHVFNLKSEGWSSAHFSLYCLSGWESAFFDGISKLSLCSPFLQILTCSSNGSLTSAPRYVRTTKTSCPKLNQHLWKLLLPHPPYHCCWLHHPPRNLQANSDRPPFPPPHIQ